MTSIRFVHAADLHLDSPFRGIRSEAPDYVRAVLTNATFSAYRNIIDLCLREKVDALLVAGDIYDGADRSLRAQLKFRDGLEQLDSAGIRSFVCHGNHDPLNGWEARLTMPPGCVRFGAEMTSEPVFPDAPERAMVYGISYPKREVLESLTHHFQDVPAGDFNIGLLHANVGSNTGHDPYAPCTVADLSDAPINYWALGHVHTRNVLRDQYPTIVYPGNPQGRHVNEAGERGVYMVEVDDSGNVAMDFRPVDVVRWESRTLDIAGVDTEQALSDAIDKVAESALALADGRHVIVRLTLSGRGALHRWLRLQDTAGDLLERLNQRYARLNPWLWCERIQVETAPPIDRAQAAQREDFVGNLLRLGQELRASPEVMVELQEALKELYAGDRTRHYLLSHLPQGNGLLELLVAAEEECLAGLASEDEGP